MTAHERMTAHALWTAWQALKITGGEFLWWCWLLGICFDDDDNPYKVEEVSA